MSSYPSIGNISRLSAVFTDQNGVAADPTNVTVAYKVPGSGSVTATPVRDSVGNYHYDVTLTAPGTWWYRFVGTGAITAQTGDQSFYVPPTNF